MLLPTVRVQAPWHQAPEHERRMRRERLIQPTDPVPIAGMIRHASVTPGTGAQTPDAA
ncbi:TPA: hypothetical protein RY456_003602 [Escherichia albertii]|nr:hypothetical protein [Escherichia albertii]HEB1608331.1 hypothetical protein [Escherichia albertii]